jgi:hypothetical protein
MPHLAMASHWPRVCGRLHVDVLPRRPLRPRASPNGAQLPFGEAVYSRRRRLIARPVHRRRLICLPPGECAWPPTGEASCPRPGMIGGQSLA